MSTGGAESFGGRNHRPVGGRGREKEVSSSNWQPVVIGGSILDLTAKIQSNKIKVSETSWLVSGLFLMVAYFLHRIRVPILEVWCTHLEAWPEM